MRLPGFPLVVEQPFLAPQAAAVAAEGAVGANDAVAGDDEAKHVRPIGTAHGALGVGDAELPGHPAVRARFASGDGAQEVPGPALEFRSDRREGKVELQILAREIISKLNAEAVEMWMLAGDDVGPKATAQDGQLAFECAAVGEFEQAQTFIAGDREHGPEGRVDPFGEEGGPLPGRGGRISKDAREGFAKAAGGFKATLPLGFADAAAAPYLTQGEAHAPG